MVTNDWKTFHLLGTLIGTLTHWENPDSQWRRDFCPGFAHRRKGTQQSLWSRQIFVCGMADHWSTISWHSAFLKDYNKNKNIWRSFASSIDVLSLIDESRCDNGQHRGSYPTDKRTTKSEETRKQTKEEVRNSDIASKICRDEVYILGHIHNQGVFLDEHGETQILGGISSTDIPSHFIYRSGAGIPVSLQASLL